LAANLARFAPQVNPARPISGSPTGMASYRRVNRNFSIGPPQLESGSERELLSEFASRVGMISANLRVHNG